MNTPVRSLPLLPAAADREDVLRTVAERLNRHWEELPRRPVGPELTREQIAQCLGSFDFDNPMPLPEAITRVSELLEEGIIHVGHPRYFGLFNPSPGFAAIVGDILASGYNPQLAVRSHAPAAVDIENRVIEAVGIRFGFPADSVHGHFTSGGSEANMTAALAALTRAFPSYAEDGLASLPRRPLLYVSRESHYAWFKIAHQLGLGRGAVQLVLTDGTGRMDPADLEKQLVEDRSAGGDPFLIAATAGTTNAGMIDPLHACADVAGEHQLWLHVDAAWAGGLVASHLLKDRLSGIERADSITVDAHKWFAVPMGAGMYIGRDRQSLTQAFRVSTSYMPSTDAAEDPYLASAQWSRRLIGLRLFMSLASAGWAGHAQAVDGQIAMADLLRQKLAGEGFRTVNDSPVGVLCFLPPDGESVQDIVARVQSAGRCWISVSQFEHKEVIRAGVTSFRTTEADVDALIAELTGR